MRLFRRSMHMGVAWLLLSVCFWAAGTACLNFLIPASAVSKVSMRFAPKEAPSFGGMDRYFEEKAVRKQEEALPGSVTAWTEERNQEISAKEWNINVSVDIYYVDGNVSDVMDLKLIAGGFPDRADKKGISIDVVTAAKLFGSTTPIGLNVMRGGKEYIVRGIFEQPEKIMAWGSDTGRGLAVFAAPQAAPAPPAAPDSLNTGNIGVQGAEFLFPAGLSPDEAKNAAMSLAGKMGLNGAAYTYDHSAGNTLLRQLAQLPGWTMMIIAVLMLLHAAYSQTRMMLRMGRRYAGWRSVSKGIARNTMLRGVMFGSVLVLLSACVYLTVRPDLSLPPSYIPTQWSDTEFWPKLVKQLLIDKAERNALPIARPDAIKNALEGWGKTFIGASLVCLYLLHTSLRRVLGRSAASRLRRHPYDWPHPSAQWESSCYILLLAASVAPSLGLKLVELLGLPPSISGTAFTMQVLPAVMVSVELLLRLWPSALWPLRFSPAAALRNIAVKSMVHPGRLSGGMIKGLAFSRHKIGIKPPNTIIPAEDENMEG